MAKQPAKADTEMAWQVTEPHSPLVPFMRTDGEQSSHGLVPAHGWRAEPRAALPARGGLKGILRSGGDAAGHAAGAGHAAPPRPQSKGPPIGLRFGAA